MKVWYNGHITGGKSGGRFNDLWGVGDIERVDENGCKIKFGANGEYQFTILDAKMFPENFNGKKEITLRDVKEKLKSALDIKITEALQTANRKDAERIIHNAASDVFTKYSLNLVHITLNEIYVYEEVRKDETD